MRKFLLYIFILMAAAATAAPIDDAKKLYQEGDYEAALQKLMPLVKKTPRDGTINYWTGATLIALHRDEEALPYIRKARERGVADAALMLARIARDQYRPSEAREMYDHYETLLAKNKKSVPEEVVAEQSVAVMMENMLSRVEKIAVIDSIVVDADEFFKAYRLSPEAGRIVEGDMVHLPDVDLAFVPQNRSQILFAEPDTAGNFRLMSADVLDDGTVDSPRPLPGEDLSGGGNAEFPFLMADGMTLYFANDGEESLGGYDIFLTRRSDDGNYMLPQNVGMPYNSPYDDYLLAIDETTGLGWWATDRNQLPGQVTIYVFVPSESRVNVPADDPNLISLARLSDISLTRTPGANYPSIPEAENLADGDAARGNNGSFVLPIASTSKIYTSLSDFRSPQARKSMSDAINARILIEKLELQLADLRDRYSKGAAAGTADRILDLEEQLDKARGNYQRFVNAAIKAETATSR